MAVEGNIYCPKCRSKNYERTMGSQILHAGKGLLAVGAGVGAGVIKAAFKIPVSAGGGSLTKAILADGSYDYECKNCGCEFRVSFISNKVTKIEAI